MNKKQERKIQLLAVKHYVLNGGTVVAYDEDKLRSEISGFNKEIEKLDVQVSREAAINYCKEIENNPESEEADLCILSEYRYYLLAGHPLNMLRDYQEDQIVQTAKMEREFLRRVNNV